MWNRSSLFPFHTHILSLHIYHCRSFSFSILWSATSTYFRIGKNWHAATDLPIARQNRRGCHPSPITSITSCISDAAPLCQKYICRAISYENISREDAYSILYDRFNGSLALIFSRRFHKKSFCVKTFLGSAGGSILLFARSLPIPGRQILETRRERFTWPPLRRIRFMRPFEKR